VEIHVLQGERKMAADNRTLGRFILDGIPPAPRGMPQIEVAFDIDANGIVHVSAKDKATGKEQKIKIEASSGLSENEIESMVKDAELHQEEDQQKREKVERRNQADALAFEVEKQLNEYGEKIDPAERARLEGALSDTRKALEGEDDGEIQASMQKLSEIWQQVGSAFYQQYQQSQQGEGESPGEAGDGAPDNTVDADYEVVDD
jgi:molecular chaperone DnaK